MKKMQIILTTFLVLVGISVLAYKYFAVGTDPDFSQITLQKDALSQPVALQSLQGKATIIAFFQTWCGDCIREIPTLIALQKSMQSSDLQILLVTDEPEEKVTYFKNKFSLFTLDFYYTTVPLKELGIKKYPTTYLIDIKRKTLLKTLEGYDWNSDQSREMVGKLVKRE